MAFLLVLFVLALLSLLALAALVFLVVRLVGRTLTTSSGSLADETPDAPR